MNTDGTDYHSFFIRPDPSNPFHPCFALSDGDGVAQRGTGTSKAIETEADHPHHLQGVGGNSEGGEGYLVIAEGGQWGDDGGVENARLRWRGRGERATAASVTGR